MYSERLQILLTPDQRRRIEAEARRRGSSIAQVIRDGLDQYLGAPSTQQRQNAVSTIARMDGKLLDIQELHSIIASEREGFSIEGQ